MQVCKYAKWTKYMQVCKYAKGCKGMQRDQGKNLFDDYGTTAWDRLRNLVLICDFRLSSRANYKTALSVIHGPTSSILRWFRNFPSTTT